MKCSVFPGLIRGFMLITSLLVWHFFFILPVQRKGSYSIAFLCFILYKCKYKAANLQEKSELPPLTGHVLVAAASSCQDTLGWLPLIGGRLPGIASDQGKQVRTWTSPNDLRSQRGRNSSLQVVPRPGSDELASRRNCFKWR